MNSAVDKAKAPSPAKPRAQEKQRVAAMKREYRGVPTFSPRRAPLATDLGDAYLAKSHAAHFCYSGDADKKARRYYDQALAADPAYYQARMGLCGSLIDAYHHSCRTHFWRKKPRGDVYAYEQALIAWSQVIARVPNSMVKTWLRSPDLLFERRATPRTMFLYREHVVPALGGILATSDEATAPDEELLRLTFDCTRRLVKREPWLIDEFAPYLLDAARNPGLSALNMPEFIRILDEVAHAPVQQGETLARLSKRLRHRFEYDSGAYMLLVGLQKIIIDAYSQQDVLVTGALEELGKLAIDNVPMAYSAYEVMLGAIITIPAVAPAGIMLLAQSAAQSADDNIADADVLAYHVIDQLRRIANLPKPGVAMAVANALQGPLRTYYDAYRAREEDARAAGDDADVPPAGAAPPFATRAVAR